MKPVQKIYPTSQNLLGSQLLRNDTPKPSYNNKIDNNAQNPSIKNALNIQSNNNIPNQDEFLVETDTKHNITKKKTNQNNNNTTNLDNNPMQLSQTSNKSYQKMSGFKGIEELKKRFLLTIEAIVATRLVEFLGGLAKIEEKKQAVERFSILWAQLLDILQRVTESIELMNFDQVGVVENTNQLISEVVTECVKEMESQYLDLIINSALRFLDTVCTVHDIQYKQLINLRFDIRSWKKYNIDNIKSNNFKGRSLSLTGNLNEENQSFIRQLCSCCFKPQKNSSQVRPQPTDMTQNKLQK